MQEQSVLSFDQYRKYLQITFQARKSRQPGLTLGSFSKFLGFGSENYFGLIIHGKRNLTVEQIHIIGEALKLTYDKTTYFEALVLHNQANTPAEKQFYIRRLQDIRKNKPKSNSSLSSKMLLGEWYFPVIALLAEGEGVDQAIARLSKILPIPKSAVESNIEKLIDSEILKIEDGVCRLNTRHQVFHDTQSRSLRHKSFLRNQLKLSSRMLEKSYEKGARFYAHTFTIAKEDLPYYEDRIRGLLADFTARSDQSSVDDVVQLNAQLFRIGPECF